MTAFIFLVGCTALVGVLAYWRTWWTTCDPLHPLLIAIPIALFFGVWQPLVLFGQGELDLRFGPREAEFAQTINVIFFFAFCIGGISASSTTRWRAVGTSPQLPQEVCQRLFITGIVFGVVGAALRGWLIMKGGGVNEMYGRPYGGSTVTESGWLLDSWYICFSGVILIAASSQGRPLRLYELLGMAFCAAPHFMHALLGARRGPLFVSIVVSALSYYFYRNQRPRLWLVWVGGFLLGVCILLLLANRQHIYIGSDRPIQESVTKGYALSGGEGVEFAVGGAMAVTADKLDRYGLGAEWLTVLLVRPVPRQWLPDKYEIIPNPSVNARDVQRVMRWTPGPGSAPTLFFELFFQFQWFGGLVAAGIGWAIVRTWRRALQHRSLLAVALYICVAQGLLHLIAQDFKAFVVPFLVMFVPCWAALKVLAATTVTPRLAPRGVKLRSLRLGTRPR